MPRRPLRPEQLDTWQRALDLMVEFYAMSERLSERDFELLGRSLWRQGMLMLSEITMMANAPYRADRHHHAVCAHRALARLHALVHLGRQLRLLDVEPELLERFDRQRLALERARRHLERAGA